MWHEQCLLNVTRWSMWTQPPIFSMLTAYRKRFRGRITRIIITHYYYYTWKCCGTIRTGLIRWWADTHHPGCCHLAALTFLASSNAGCPNPHDNVSFLLPRERVKQSSYRPDLLQGLAFAPSLFFPTLLPSEDVHGWIGHTLVTIQQHVLTTRFA